MIIKNGTIFQPDGTFRKGNLYTADGKITVDTSADGIEIDAEGYYVVPGFVDVHTHGAMGYDFCDASLDSIEQIAAYEFSSGVTSFCPTSMTLSEETLTDIFSTAASFDDAGLLKGTSDRASSAQKTWARVMGINMEGPFIAPNKMGAQSGSHIVAPDIEMFHRLNKASNYKIRLITMAPEVPGATEFIDAVSDQVHISAGHTTTDYATAMEAFSHGADHATHLFNAMPSLHHREPGLIGAVVDSPHVYAEIICDGIHIHPAIIRSTYRLLGGDRMVLVSDSMEAAGMEDGTYALGGQAVYKKGSHATLADGTLAGSVTNLFCCFQNAVKYGIPLEDAVKMATINPARSIGQGHLIGTFAPGAYADILLLDKDCNLVRVIRG